MGVGQSHDTTQLYKVGQADTSKAQRQYPRWGAEERDCLSFAEGQDLAQPALASQDEVVGGRRHASLRNGHGQSCREVKIQ